LRLPISNAGHHLAGAQSVDKHRLKGKTPEQLPSQVYDLVIR